MTSERATCHFAGATELLPGVEEQTTESKMPGGRRLVEYSKTGLEKTEVRQATHQRPISELMMLRSLPEKIEGKVRCAIAQIVV